MKYWRGSSNDWSDTKHSELDFVDPSVSRITIDHIRHEVLVTTSRSGGPGGQHVNKVETKVVLRWKVETSEVLDVLQKQLVRAANASKLTKDDELIVTADGHRSQLRNKEVAWKKLDRLLAKAFTRKKVRKPTQPSKAAKQKRLQEKRRHSEKKAARRKGF